MGEFFHSPENSFGSKQIVLEDALHTSSKQIPSEKQQQKHYQQQQQKILIQG